MLVATMKHRSTVWAPPRQGRGTTILGGICMVEQAESKNEKSEKSDEHGHSKKVAIIVNGRQKTVDENVLTFEQVVALAFPTPPTGENIVFTVTFRKARGERHEGILHPGEDVKIKEGTTFNVRYTDKS